MDKIWAKHFDNSIKEYEDTPHVHDKNSLGGVRAAYADEIPR